MIVFNLACSHEHPFDGWFRSADDFERQSKTGMLVCPLCGDQHIVKRLSAPRINVGATNLSATNVSASGVDGDDIESINGASSGPQEVIAASMLPGLQAHLLQQFKQFVVSNTENVGGAFAETARRMHYGEESHRNIRGRVSAEESQALRDEGIETLGLPVGIFLDEGVQ